MAESTARPSATVVLVGRVPGDPDSLATMWVIPGEPVTAVAVPLWVEAGASPPELWQGDEAPLWAASARLKDLARPFREGNKDDYLNMTVLDNAAGTGYLPETKGRILLIEDVGEELYRLEDATG